jgi:hypothetical protein
MRACPSEAEVKVAYWRDQLALAEGATPSPTRDLVVATCRERLAIWERRAQFVVIEGGGVLRRERGAA